MGHRINPLTGRKAYYESKDTEYAITYADGTTINIKGTSKARELVRDAPENNKVVSTIIVTPDA